MTHTPDPFTVSRTAAGIVIASDDQTDRYPETCTLTLTTRQDVDRFRDYLSTPTGDTATDDWLGILTVGTNEPVEPRVGSVLHLDWPEGSMTPVARLTLLFWVDYSSPHLSLDLDLEASGRLRAAIGLCVDDALPRRHPDPSSFRGVRVPERNYVHPHDVWAVCSHACFADRRKEVEIPF